MSQKSYDIIESKKLTLNDLRKANYVRLTVNYNDVITEYMQSNNDLWYVFQFYGDFIDEKPMVNTADILKRIKNGYYYVDIIKDEKLSGKFNRKSEKILNVESMF